MTNYTSTRKLGAAYLDSSMFLDEANQTTGTPIIGPNMEQLINNRRNVTSRLTEAGKEALRMIKAKFRREYNVDVALRWDIHAGCGGCPCSPGFSIKIPTEQLNKYTRNYSSRLREDEQFKVWVNEDGSLDFRIPKWLPIEVPSTLVGLA